MLLDPLDDYKNKGQNKAEIDILDTWKSFHPKKSYKVVIELIGIHEELSAGTIPFH